MTDGERIAVLEARLAGLERLSGVERDCDRETVISAMTAARHSADKTEAAQALWNATHNDLMRRIDRQAADTLLRVDADRRFGELAARLDDVKHVQEGKCGRDEYQTGLNTASKRLELAVDNWNRGHSELIDRHVRDCSDLAAVDAAQQSDLTALRAGLATAEQATAASGESRTRSRTYALGIVGAVYFAASLSLQGWIGWQQHTDRTRVAVVPAPAASAPALPAATASAVPRR